MPWRRTRVVMGNFNKLSLTNRVSFTTITRELGLPRDHVGQLLTLLGPYLGADRRRTSKKFGLLGITYDARIIDRLRMVRGQPVSRITGKKDWLADYIEKGSHGRTAEHPGPSPELAGAQGAGRDEHRERR